MGKDKRREQVALREGRGWAPARVAFDASSSRADAGYRRQSIRTIGQQGDSPLPQNVDFLAGYAWRSVDAFDAEAVDSLAVPVQQSEDESLAAFFSTEKQAEPAGLFQGSSGLCKGLADDALGVPSNPLSC